MSFPESVSYPEKSQATTALVFGIIGLICCGPLAIVGWVMANNELAGIAAGLRSPSNEGTAKAARVVGIIGTVLFAIGIISSSVWYFGGVDIPFFPDL